MNDLPRNDLDKQSEELFHLYEQLPAVIKEDWDEAGLASAEDDEERARKIYGASQWQLMWRKFTQQGSHGGGSHHFALLCRGRLCRFPGPL